MTLPQPQGQLEFFDLANQPKVKPRPPSLGRFFVSLRYDQAVLCGIAGLIGLTVVFAFGVERGKQLNRTERALITREERPGPLAAPLTTVAAAPAVAASAAKKPAAEPGQVSAKDAPVIVPSATVKKKEPSKLAATGGRRYAIQAASYRQAQSAKRELDRLVSSGERAFLVMKDGYTIVYLGPFPSKIHAAEKVTLFKTRYQGCFVRAL